jgi:hypothetical protein
LKKLLPVGLTSFDDVDDTASGVESGVGADVTAEVGEFWVSVPKGGILQTLVLNLLAPVAAEIIHSKIR